MSTVAVRKQAPRPARPAARYWKGKAPKGVADVDSDSDADEVPQQEEEGDVPMDGEQELGESEDEDEDEDTRVHARESAVKSVKSMNVSLKDVSISKEGKVIVAGREESGRTVLEAEGSEGEEEEEEEEEEPRRPRAGQQAETESSESESGSDEDEEEHAQSQFRPVFIPKRARVTVAEREAIAQDTEEALKKKELEIEERRKQSHDLVAESIKRELAEKETDELVPDVDDTDGLDPTAEFEAWRLRELGRIKRDKEEEIMREEEREEVERRRAMPEEQRMKEDLERAKKSRDEKPKGQQKFLQKYWHKGAFHQDEEILKRHDFTEATESVLDVSLLPKVMQVKNFGKRSRTKYTHLVDQDTTLPTGGFGSTASTKAAGKPVNGSGCFLCGGPHLKKDCPQNTGPIPPHMATGSNASAPTAPRSWGARDTWRDRDRDEHHDDRDRRRDYGRERDQHERDGRGDTWGNARGGRGDRGGRDGWRENGVNRRRRSRSPMRSKSRSRSRSPPDRKRYVDRSDERRDRGRSWSVEREDRDKRRRLD